MPGRVAPTDRVSHAGGGRWLVLIGDANSTRCRELTGLLNYLRVWPSDSFVEFQGSWLHISGGVVGPESEGFADGSIDWADGLLIVIDQRRLPHELRRLQITTVDEVIDAIKTLAIRGAPAIGG